MPTILAIPVFSFYWVAFVLVFGTFAILIFLMFANHPSNKTPSGFVPFRRWPKIFGKRIWPIWPTVIFVLTYFITSLDAGSLKVLAIIGADLGLSLLIIITLMIIVAIVMNIGMLRKKVGQFETWQLFKGYVKAKKDRVCPIVEFVEEKKTEEKK